MKKKLLAATFLALWWEILLMKVHGKLRYSPMKVYAHAIYSPSCPRVNACSESNRTKFNSDRLGSRASVCARALLIGVDKTCDGQYCPEVNAGFLPRKE